MALQIDWGIVREVYQTVATAIVVPALILEYVRRKMIAKVWPATFFDVQKGRAIKEPRATPPTIQIKVVVRLNCRVVPIDRIYLEAFGQKNGLHNSPEFMEQYAEGFSYKTQKGKTPAFEISTRIRGLEEKVIERWGGGQAVLVIEHGWRKDKRAIRTTVEVGLQK